MSSSTAVEATNTVGLITPEKPSISKARKPKVGNVAIVPEAPKGISKPRRGKPIELVAPTPEPRKPIKKLKLPKSIPEVAHESPEPESKASEPLIGYDVYATAKVTIAEAPVKAGDIRWPAIAELEQAGGSSITSGELFDPSDVVAWVTKSLPALSDGKTEFFIWDWSDDDDDSPAGLVTYESWDHNETVTAIPSKSKAGTKPVSWWFDPKNSNED